MVILQEACKRTNGFMFSEEMSTEIENIFEQKLSPSLIRMYRHRMGNKF
jgi:hypothetical protein